MVGRISRSFRLVKESYRILKQDKNYCFHLEYGSLKVTSPDAFKPLLRYNNT